VRGEVPQYSLSVQESNDLVSALHEFHTMSMLKKVIVEVVAFSLPPDSIERMRDVFLVIDTDRCDIILHASHVLTYC
jgi:hypothetical protein